MLGLRQQLCPEGKLSPPQQSRHTEAQVSCCVGSTVLRKGLTPGRYSRHCARTGPKPSTLAHAAQVPQEPRNP